MKVRRTKLNLYVRPFIHRTKYKCTAIFIDPLLHEILKDCRDDSTIDSEFLFVCRLTHEATNKLNFAIYYLNIFPYMTFWLLSVNKWQHARGCVTEILDSCKQAVALFKVIWDKCTQQHCYSLRRDSTSQVLKRALAFIYRLSVCKSILATETGIEIVFIIWTVVVNLSIT